MTKVTLLTKDQKLRNLSDTKFRPKLSGGTAEVRSLLRSSRLAVEPLKLFHFKTAEIVVDICNLKKIDKRGEWTYTFAG